MALTPGQQAILLRTDSTRVARVFSKLVSNWQHGRWLAAGNRYAINCTQKIEQDSSAAGRLRHGNLASYVAASSVIHCMDGWSFLARAVEGELSGDIDAARHLAYYAELRAGMSLLAGVGVGVFNKKHVTVNATKRCEIIRGPTTHTIVWDALEYWAQQPAATDLILDVIRPGGKPLSEWLTHFPPTAGGGFRSVLASQWLLKWGLDLQRLSLDRDSRNESSYRPTFIAHRRRPTMNQSLNFMEQLWRANEPSGANPFGVIDRYLLRRSLASAFQANHPGNLSPRQAPAKFARLMGPVFHALMPTPGDLKDIQWNHFLNFRKPTAENDVVAQAEREDTISSPQHHLQVIARATILLRVATGATRKLLMGLGTGDLKHLSFWWRPIGEAKGLWDIGAQPAQFSDLWADIDFSLNRLQAWRAAGGGSKKKLFEDLPEVPHSLSSCERVALWGMGL